MDWRAWHDRYEDPSSPLAQRLLVVQRLVREALAASTREPVRILSLCAGDGRDLLPVLAEQEPSRAVRARLIEADPELAARARAAAPDGVEVLEGDAACTDNYAGAVPADLVLACGVFGNVSDEDVARTVAALPSLCAAGGAVVWTRHRRAPDLTPAIRAGLARAGFEERAFASPGPDSWAVGLHVLTAPPLPLQRGVRLFLFNR